MFSSPWIVQDQALTELTCIEQKENNDMKRM